MNLHLSKIKRQNAFDYSTLSEFMKKKNGKLIFTAGFGNADIVDKNQNARFNLMEKYERHFHFQSIIKSYNEAFHIQRKKPNKKKQITRQSLYLPQINNSIKSFYKKLNQSYTCNHFYKNNNILKNSSEIKNSINSVNSKNTNNFHKSYSNDPYRNIFENENDNSIDYTNYFYHTIDYFPPGNHNEKDSNLKKYSSTSNCYFSTKNNKNLIKNISQDCIYLFGKNKIIYKNKKSNYRKNFKMIENKVDIQKNPFIDYNPDFNPSKTKHRLKKNFEFYKDKTK
jgi:hypothetical protein